MIGIASNKSRQSHHTSPWQRTRIVIGNVIELVMLQGRLAEVDFRQWRAGLGASIGLLAVGGFCLLGSIPVLVYCLGAMMQTWTGVTLTQGLLIAVGLTIALGAALGCIGWLRLIHSFSTFDRTRTELVRNLEWLKGRMADDADDDFSGPTNN